MVMGQYSTDVIMVCECLQMSLYISPTDKLRIVARMLFSGGATSTQRAERRASTCRSMVEKLLLLAYGQIAFFLELPSESETIIKRMRDYLEC